MRNEKRTEDIAHLIHNGVSNTKEIAKKLNSGYTTINLDKKIMVELGLLERAGSKRDNRVQLTREGLKKFGYKVEGYKSLYNTEVNIEDSEVLELRMNILAYLTFNFGLREIREMLNEKRKKISKEVAELKVLGWITKNNNVTELGELILDNYEGV